MSVNSHTRKCSVMITLRPGSHVHRLVTILAITGEFPMRSLHLIGNARVLRALIRRLTSAKTIRNPNTDERLTTKLLQITGKGSSKSIRFYKGALPILEWIRPGLYCYYMASFWNHRFPGDAAHRDRNLRVAEAVALCMGAGIESRPYLLPQLQNDRISLTVSNTPSFYLARDLKKINPPEQSKTMFTRNVGAIFSEQCCYAVYNTRNAAMKWSGMGEFKALHSMIEIARMNAGLSAVDSAILFGASEKNALQTLLESERSKRLEFRFDGIYRHVYFIPMDNNGTCRLRMLVSPDWKEKLLDLLFEPDGRSYDKGFMEYDAYVNGAYIFSHLDGDLARLIRFREGLASQTGMFEVLCFPDQVPLLREYLGPRVALKTIDMRSVEMELGLDRRSIFE